MAGAISSNGQAVCITVAGIMVPCIIRDGKPHGPVRVLEEKLLSQLSSTEAVNAAFRSRRLLVSKYLTDSEAVQLTDVARSLAAGGPRLVFSMLDLVVDIDDFMDLYTYVKSELQSVSGGWMQLNNRSSHELIAKFHFKNRPEF